MTVLVTWVAICFLVVGTTQGDLYEEYYGTDGGNEPEQYGEYGEATTATTPVAANRHQGIPKSATVHRNKNLTNDLSQKFEERNEVPYTNTRQQSDIANTRAEAIVATCDRHSMSLKVERSSLPHGLRLHVPSNLLPSCVNVTFNTESIIYQVALACHHVVRKEVDGPRVFAQHDALFVRKGSKVSKSNPYSVVYTILMECDQLVHDNATAALPPRAEAHVYEHRVTSGSSSNCERQECPYGEMCLLPELVSGYYCVCSGPKCKLSCPKDYYGCQRSNVSQTMFDHLQCISNGWLCDNRFDCELKEDEFSCTDTWSTWSAWSKCSGTCGEGKQNRKRKCDLSFTPDPDRCKIHPGALGCSRRCSSNKQMEMETRPCQLSSCSSVTCDERIMTVVIPREPGMTSKAIQTRMLIGGDPACKPSYTDTHVIFVTSLNKCNTSSQVNGDSVTYRNEIVFNPSNDASSIIMRDVGHSYSVKCRYNRRRTVLLSKKPPNHGHKTEAAALSFEHENDRSWPADEAMMQEHHASGDGDFEFKMNLYKEGNYLNAYARQEYPLHVPLRKEIFIGIRFGSDDPDLTVAVERCQATPDTLDHSQLNYVFIDGGCAVDGTVEFYDRRNDMATFSLQAFKFTNQTLPFVYFQCDVVVCDVGDDEPICRRNCSETSSSRKKRSARDVEDNERSRGHVTIGPLIVEELDGGVTETEEQSEERSVVHRKLVIDADTLDQPQDESLILPTLYLVIGILASVLFVMFAGMLVATAYRKPSRPTSV